MIMTPLIYSAGVFPGLRRIGLVLGLFGWCGSVLFIFPSDSLAKAKQSRGPSVEPELKIVGLNIVPTPDEPGNGPLEFSVVVQLPKELNGGAILEVTSLISSPSKTSLRFLTHRQSVDSSTGRKGNTERARLVIDLTWDGLDHRKQLVTTGTYSYEVRTKLLADGDKGPRTMMVAWPKRGTIAVK